MFKKKKTDVIPAEEKELSPQDGEEQEIAAEANAVEFDEADGEVVDAEIEEIFG